MLEFVGQQEPTHCDTRGAGHEPIETNTRGWTIVRRIAPKTDEARAFVGERRKAGGSLMASVGEREGQTGEVVGIAVESASVVLEHVAKRRKVLQPTLDARILFAVFCNYSARFVSGEGR